MKNFILLIIAVLLLTSCTHGELKAHDSATLNAEAQARAQAFSQEVSAYLAHARRCSTYGLAKSFNQEKTAFLKAWIKSSLAKVNEIGLQPDYLFITNGFN